MELGLARRRLLGTLLLIITGVMLANSERVFIGAVYASLIPMAALSLRLLLFDPGARVGVAKKRFCARRAILCAGLTLLWLLSLSFMEMHNSRMFSYSHLMHTVYPGQPLLARFYYYFQRYVYLPAACFSVWYILYGVFSACATTRRDGLPAVLPAEERDRLVRRCWLVIVVATVFGVLCVYPIYNVSDTLLLKQYIDNGEWNAWHTMGYLFFAWLTSLGGTNYFLVVVAQGCCWAYANRVALRALSERGNGGRACVTYTILSLLSFLPYLYCSIMYKDGLYTSCMLGFCVSVVELMTQDAPRRAVLVRLALFGLGAALFRLGTFPIVLATLLAVLLYTYKKRRALLIRTAASVAALLCAYVFFNRILPYNILSAVKTPEYVKYAVPLNMIGAVAKSGVEIQADELALMERILPREEWAEAYNPYFMDPLSRTDEAIGKNVEKIDAQGLGPDLLRLNARFLMRYPRVYLTAFFNANSIVWEWGCPDDGRAAEWRWMLQFARTMEPGEAAVATRTFGTTRIMVSIANATYENPIYRCLIWRGGCSLFVLIVCAAALIVKRRAEWIIALLPPLGNAGILMLTIPSQDPRYILPTLVTAVFFGVCVFCTVERKEDGPA